MPDTIVKKITLNNFRNHKNLTVEFDEGTNLIVGPNGIGKTNILEAIHLMSSTKSFRAKYDRDMIKKNEGFAKIKMRVTNNGNADDLEMNIVVNPKFENTSSKTVKINSAAKSLDSFSSAIGSVLFSPEDIDLITGAPALRRKYLNMLLFQADRKYKKDTGDYLKAVIRRNKLLEKIRETGRGYDELPFWNEKILSTGEYIQNKRQEVLSYLDSFLKQDATSKIRKGENFGVKYVMNQISTKRLLEYKDREISAGRTLVGPHRDDIEFTIEGASMAQFSSRGEQRTAVFLVKQAECGYIKAQLGTEPVLLLDDIFSELDREHREAVISFISGRQTFITAAVEREFTDLYINKTIRLPLE